MKIIVFLGTHTGLDYSVNDSLWKPEVQSVEKVYYKITNNKTTKQNEHKRVK